MTTVCGKVIAARKEKNKGKKAIECTSKKKYTPASPIKERIQKGAEDLKYFQFLWASLGYRNDN